MYKKGDLFVTTKPCESFEPDINYCDDHESVEHRVYDCKDDREFGVDVAYLPHSCDHWVIGGEVEIKDMIEDLQIALQTIKERDKK